MEIPLWWRTAAFGAFAAFLTSSCVPEQVEVKERLTLTEADVIGEWRALEGVVSVIFLEDGNMVSDSAICGLLVEGLDGDEVGRGGEISGTWEIDTINERVNDAVSLRISRGSCSEGSLLNGLRSRENGEEIQLYVWQDGVVPQDRVFVRAEPAER